MPNWCSNILRITTEDATIIDKIIKGIENDEGLFALFYPIPEELNYQVGHPPTKTDEEIQALREKYGATDWYDWSLKNWGCKWDACDIDITDGGTDSLSIIFSTPWGPPIDFYKKFANDYKVEIYADYSEEGMDFCGKFQSYVLDGEVYANEDYRNIDEMRNDILSCYLVANKDKEVTPDDFLHEVRSLYSENYPKVNDYYDCFQVFNDYWIESRLEDDEFCKQYGIINKTTN
jgi:hypothetical protein